jgi:predicted O-methyltransferase YrrM
MEERPPLVERAHDLARAAGFPTTREEAGPDRPSASLPGTGRFLAMLAAGCAGGRIAEFGTGAAIGTSWMAAAMPGGCSLVTVELDPRMADLARRLLAGEPGVKVLTGDGFAVLAGRGPFDLLFADSGVRDAAAFDRLVRLLRVGGRIVMDDVTPTAVRGGEPPPADAIKRALFTDPRLVAVEVVLPDLENSLLVGTRIR